MQKIVFIVGPTGVGKTDLAFNIAHKFDCELLSSDSVQVFCELDIISGKDLPKGYTFHAGYYSSNSGPSIHLLDVVDSTAPFSVSQFEKKAQKVIKGIIERNKLPVVVGGSGLYVKSLIEGFNNNSIKPNPKLRNELVNLGILELKTKLDEVDSKKFESMNDSDKNNARRLIRAIEIAKSNLPTPIIRLPTAFDSLVIGLMCDRDLLRRRIDSRVEKRMKFGALDEAKKLFKIYDSLTQQVKDANGYKQLFQYLKEEIDLNEATYRWKISEYRHAKSQMTWFRKYGGAVWFDITKENFKKEIRKRVKEFLNSSA